LNGFSAVLGQLAVSAEPLLQVSMGTAQGSSQTVKLVVLMTLLSFAPAIVLSMSCFTRFIVVFAFLRHALGVPGAPPAQVMTGLALFMTAFVMWPTIDKVHTQAVAPYMDGKIDEKGLVREGTGPMRDFMLRLTREEDVALFLDAAHQPQPKTVADLSLGVLVPAFITSELRTSFQMGIAVLVPFLVIDLMVASVLMGLGMAMLSPMLVSLPLKVLVFVAVDGWGLVIGSLMKGMS
jgi:flagellar biosynthetic protein FliP